MKHSRLDLKFLFQGIMQFNILRNILIMFDIVMKTPHEFYTTILTQSIAALKINTFMDNFDERHFNFDGVDRSKTFNAEASTFYFDWFFRNHQSLWSVYELLADEHSKILYANIIAFRLASHFSIRLPVSFVNRQEELEEFNKVATCTDSELGTNGMFGKLKHYNFYYKGNQYLFDGTTLEYCLFRNQYFYERNDISIKPEPGETVIDGGACLGDTAAVFSYAVGQHGKVLSFDPVKENLSVLEYNVNQFPLKNVTIIPFGLSNINAFCEPVSLGGYSPGFRASTPNIPLRTLDNMVTNNEIGTFHFIKMDIEGSELNALAGAELCLSKFKPKLAISLYHNPDDLFTIPLYIKQKHPFYSMHIDQYTIHNDETVLYCIAK